MPRWLEVGASSGTGSLAGTESEGSRAARDKPVMPTFVLGPSCLSSRGPPSSPSGLAHCPAGPTSFLRISFPGFEIPPKHSALASFPMLASSAERRKELTVLPPEV